MSAGFTVWPGTALPTNLSEAKSSGRRRSGRMLASSSADGGGGVDGAFPPAPPPLVLAGPPLISLSLLLSLSIFSVERDERCFSLLLQRQRGEVHRARERERERMREEPRLALPLSLFRFPSEFPLLRTDLNAFFRFSIVSSSTSKKKKRCAPKALPPLSRRASHRPLSSTARSRYARSLSRSKKDVTGSGRSEREPKKKDAPLNSFIASPSKNLDVNLLLPLHPR